MPNYGGSSPATQLNILGQTLRQGMLDIGNLDLARARQAYELGDPTNALRREMSQIELDEITRMDQTPATFEYAFGDMSDPVKQEFVQTHVLPQMEGHGAVAIPRPGGSGHFYSKTTGKLLTEGDFYRRRNLQKVIIGGTMHPKAALESMLHTAPDDVLPKIQQEIKNYESNPAPFFDRQIAFLESQRPMLRDPSMVDPYIKRVLANKKEAMDAMTGKKESAPKLGDKYTWESAGKIYTKVYQGPEKGWVQYESPKWQPEKTKEGAAKGAETKKGKPTPVDMNRFALYLEGIRGQEIDQVQRDSAQNQAEILGFTIDWEYIPAKEAGFFGGEKPMTYRIKSWHPPGSLADYYGGEGGQPKPVTPLNDPAGIRGSILGPEL